MIIRLRYFPPVFLLSVLIFLSGCKKGFLDAGLVNPNLTDDPPIEGLLANVTYETSLNVYRAGYFTSNYVQYLASSSASSGFDVYEDLDKSTLWSNAYDIVQDSRKLKSMGEERGALHHIGVAEATEAMNMSLLIDLFGDIPYSEAWNAGENLLPKYDKAEDIFNACLGLLDDAILQFEKTDLPVELGDNDLIHHGNTAAWVKTCYALKARLLNRLSKTSQYNPAEILEALSHAYTSNADDAQLTQFISTSPWNAVAVSNENLVLDGRLSTQFVNALNGKTYPVVDPRLKRIATLTKFNDYRGTRNGAGRVGTGTSKEESYLSTAGFYSKGGALLLLATYSEVKFIEAEARFNINKTQAYNAYLEGIKANMDKLEVSASEKNSYIASPSVSVGAGAFTKDLIFKEKYTAMFLHPEAWTDARRFDYGYKNFALPANALLTNFIRRIGYPNNEKFRNGANVPDVGSLADHLWWDE